MFKLLIICVLIFCVGCVFVLGKENQVGTEMGTGVDYQPKTHGKLDVIYKDKKLPTGNVDPKEDEDKKNKD